MKSLKTRGGCRLLSHADGYRIVHPSRGDLFCAKVRRFTNGIVTLLEGILWDETGKVRLRTGTGGDPIPRERNRTAHPG